MEEYHIRKIQNEDCSYLASLHLEYFGPSIIAAFGERFLNAAYEGMIGARWGRTIVLLKDKQKLGFVTVVFDSGKFFLEILSKKGLVMGFEVLKAAARNPLLIRNVLRAMSYPGSFSGETKAELLTVITRSNARGMGVGSRLMEEVIRIFQEAGIKRFKVSVKKNWTRAVDFYLQRGFDVIGEIDDGKEGLLFLAFDLTPGK
jgi:ribosomal protein S18 acetylase RimI-like enzyme